MRFTDRGLWGGIIILGNAVIANATAETNIEGIPEDEPRAIFGGDDDEDNSGVLKYVSIRHGGAELAAGDEINGLTLNAVGSGTTIEHIEVFSCQDDGIEFFGGTVGVKFASVAFCGDDSFDWDMGYRGKGQFWFALFEENNGDNIGELDGAAGSDDNEPHSSPEIYNVTWIGAGCGGSADNATAVYMRDGGGGRFSNSIFTGTIHAIEAEDRQAGEVDTRQRFEEGSAAFFNNLWYDFCNGPDWQDIIRSTNGAPDIQWLIDLLINQGNELTDPVFNGISRTNDGGLDPRPEEGGAAFQNLADLVEDPFFLQANYKGAFGNSLWLRNWTALDVYGFLSDTPEPQNPMAPPGCANFEVITDADLLDANYTWTSDQCYVLDGLVFLEAGGQLTIKPGTRIYGLQSPTNGDSTSALIITSGASINAQGNAKYPIVFTAAMDDLSDPNDLSEFDRGLWGGLIILGDGLIANDEEEAFLNGFNEAQIDGDYRIRYGGTGVNPYSGVLNYVSICHAGAGLNESGLMLGGVGNKTQIEQVEVYASGGNGISILGGKAALKYTTANFCTRNAYYWDLGWNGLGQFWFSIQDAANTGRAGLFNGNQQSVDSISNTSSPIVFNATFIGPGSSAPENNSVAIEFSKETGGLFNNSVITDFKGYAIEVEDLTGNFDSRQLMENGLLQLQGNIFSDFAQGNELNTGANGLIRPTAGGDSTAQFLIDGLTANNTSIISPNLVNISRVKDKTLDPRPRAPHVFNATTFLVPSNPFFTATTYAGAFGCDTYPWISGWTQLERQGFLNPNLSVLTGLNPITEEEEPFKCINLEKGTPFVLDYDYRTSPDTIKAKRIVLENLGGNLMDTCNCFMSFPFLEKWEAERALNIHSAPEADNTVVKVDTSGVELELESPILDIAPVSSNTVCTFPEASSADADKEVIVAVIDSGVDFPTGYDDVGLPILANLNMTNQIEKDNIDGQDSDDNCFPDDVEGFGFIKKSGEIRDINKHGSNIAAIIADGFPEQCKLEIMNLKVFEERELRNGEMEKLGNPFHVTCAINYAINNGAQVINLSLGYWAPEPFAPLYNAIKRALEEGVVVIVSAGNAGRNVEMRDDNGNFAWPVQFKVYDKDGYEPLTDMIVVGSLSQCSEDALAAYSNFGASIVDFATEGQSYNVFVDEAQASSVVQREVIKGTSLSAAYVARSAAVLKAFNPDLTSQQVLLALTTKAEIFYKDKDPSFCEDCLHCLDCDTATDCAECVEYLLKEDSTCLEKDCLECDKQALTFKADLFTAIEAFLEIPPDPADTKHRPPTNILTETQPFESPLRIRFDNGQRAFKNVRLRVLDNSGNQVFDSGYCIGRGIYWDGQVNGASLPPGTYLAEVFVVRKSRPSTTITLVVPPPSPENKYKKY